MQFDALNKLDDLFGQEDVYMWSTYILPNGHFLNPDNNEDYYERDFKDFLDYCTDDILRELQYNPQYIDEIVKLGVSKEYLLKEID